MFSGIIVGITWAIETIVLGIALALTPFVSTEQAVFLAPFVSTFLHDSFSPSWMCIYNGVRGNPPRIVKALKTKSGKFVALAAVIGGLLLSFCVGCGLVFNNNGMSTNQIASGLANKKVILF